MLNSKCSISDDSDKFSACRNCIRCLEKLCQVRAGGHQVPLQCLVQGALSKVSECRLNKITLDVQEIYKVSF